MGRGPFAQFLNSIILSPYTYRMDRGLIGSLFGSNYSQKGSIVPASRLIEQMENSINLVQIVQIELKIEEIKNVKMHPSNYICLGLFFLYGREQRFFSATFNLQI